MRLGKCNKLHTASSFGSNFALQENKVNTFYMVETFDGAERSRARPEAVLKLLLIAYRLE